MRTCQRCRAQYPDDVTICPTDGAPTKTAMTSGSSIDPLLGRTVGSYKLVRQLGKGGMGAVYMGEHPAIGSKVAVKFLHPQYAQIEEVVTRFFNEAKAVNLIKHDNIVQVLDYFYLDDTMPCIIMEFLDKGYALSKLSGKLNPLAVAGPVLLQVCDALQAAHEKQIIHRDLKPDNIFLAVRNHRQHFVKVMDFGIAKLASGGGEAQTQLGQVLGTPTYMSPEQAAGQVDEIGPASDIYSLGMIMYELAAGRVPFKGPVGEVMSAHLTQVPVAPRTFAAEIPAAYEAIILKAVAKKPGDRFPSMHALGQAIHTVMKELGISPELPRDDEDPSGTFAPSSASITPFATKADRPHNVGTLPDAGGPTSYPNLPAAPPSPGTMPHVAESSSPNLPAARPPENSDGATIYPDRAPQLTPNPTGPAPATPAPVAASPGTLIKSDAEAQQSQATMLKSEVAPAVASASAPVPKPSSAPRSSKRMAIVGVAFALGLATPIVLVKTGVVSFHAAAKK